MPDDLDLNNDPGNAAPAEPTPQPTPEPATSAQPAEPAATPPGDAPGATPQAPREGYVPSYRIRETREAALREAQAQFEERERAYQAHLDQVQRQLHALVGVSPPDDPEIDLARQQFAKLYPGLAKLEERANDVLGLTEKSGDMELQQRHYWQSYGRQAMDRLYSGAEKSLGAPLSPEGKRALHAAFTGYVSSSPELVQRYTTDPSIVDEFWKEFSGSLIDPVRRNAGAQAQSATTRALPQDAPSGAPKATPPPQPKNVDERIAGAWASYQAALTNNKPKLG